MNKKGFTVDEVFSPDRTDRRKSAFTLAEVLITIGIIGVVAAITMPTLIQKHQKQTTIARLKKVYSTLEQAFVSSVADNGNAANWIDENELATDQSIRAYFDLYWAPYIKVLKFCNTQKTCGYKDNVKNYNGTPSIMGFWGSGRLSLLTTDGMYILVRSIKDHYYLSKEQQFFVDINAAKGPNIYGKDIFLFVLDLDTAKIKPYGSELSDTYINRNCYGPNAGAMTTCAARIIKDGWQINYY